MILQGMSMRRAVLQCGPQPWPAQARKHPAVDGRAPQAASESPTDLLCHSERSEESFPLRTKGRGRTMPRKEEKDKRSAVKNLFWARLQMFRCAQHDGCSGSSQRSERQTKCSQTSVSSAYRFFVALLLRMTKREELRSAQRVGTKLFIVRKLRSRLE